jgi:large-conductance mechanosensitive channel
LPKYQLKYRKNGERRRRAPRGFCLDALRLLWKTVGQVQHGEEKMKSLIIGLLIIAAAVFLIVPPETAGFGLGWKTNVVDFLKGGVPVFAIVAGVIIILIGLADVKDRAEAKKDAAEKED